MTIPMENLLHQWERRCDTLIDLLGKIDGVSEAAYSARIAGKLEMCRSMTIELKRAIKEEGEYDEKALL